MLGNPASVRIRSHATHLVLLPFDYIHQLAHSRQTWYRDCARARARTLSDTRERFVAAQRTQQTGQAHLQVCHLNVARAQRRALNVGNKGTRSCFIVSTRSRRRRLGRRTRSRLGAGYSLDVQLPSEKKRAEKRNVWLAAARLGQNNENNANSRRGHLPPHWRATAASVRGAEAAQYLLHLR